MPLLVEHGNLNNLTKYEAAIKARQTTEMTRRYNLSKVKPATTNRV